MHCTHLPLHCDFAWHHKTELLLCLVLSLLQADWPTDHCANEMRSGRPKQVNHLMQKQSLVPPDAYLAPHPRPSQSLVFQMLHKALALHINNMGQGQAQLNELRDYRR